MVPNHVIIHVSTMSEQSSTSIAISMAIYQRKLAFLKSYGDSCILWLLNLHIEVIFHDYKTLVKFDPRSKE